MAKEEKEKKLLSEDRTDTVIYDRTGQENLRLSFTRRESEDDDGTEFYETIADNLESGDGTIISPGHLMRPANQGGVTLQRCSLCDRESRRNRNTNPFSPSTKMRTCFWCRVNLCSRHYYVFQNHIVCKSCRRKQFFLKKILRPIFFRRVQEI